MIKVGIIGTGNIGKRHMQSLGNLKEVEIFYHDAVKESLDTVGPFLKQEKVRIGKTFRHDGLDSFLSSIDSSTVIIIATTAKGRGALLQEVLKKKPKAVLAEKPLTQTDAEYQEILEINTEVPVYANFARHYHPFYEQLKEKVKDSTVQRIDVQMGNAGMGCNGIHWLEFIAWMAGAKEWEIISSEIFETYESKRKGFFDFSGSIRLRINRKTVAEITDKRQQPLPSCSIICDDRTYEVFESKEKFVEIGNDSFNVGSFTIPYQSQLTAKVIEDILHGRCRLPTLEQAYLPHKILFTVLERHGLDALNIT